MFIDEAGHAIEPEALIAIAGIIECHRYNGAQVVLAGDPRQLGPVIRSPVAKKCGLGMYYISLVPYTSKFFVHLLCVYLGIKHISV